MTANLRRSTSRFMGCAILVINSACGDAIVLRDADGEGSRLTYSCDGFRPQARSEQDITVLRRYALLVAKDAADHSRLDGLSELSAAYAAEQHRELEREIVRYACTFGLPEVPALAPSVFPDSGTLAPDFSLPLLRSHPDSIETIRLSDLRGRIVLLNFWASWCAPCVVQHPQVVELARAFEDEEFTVLGVLHKESPERARAWLEEHGVIGFPTVVDEHSRVARAYGVNGVPRMFLLDRQGRIINACHGCQWSPMSPARLHGVLDALLD